MYLAWHIVLNSFVKFRFVDRRLFQKLVIKDFSVKINNDHTKSIPVPSKKGEGSIELPPRHIGISAARINQPLHPVR